MNDQGGNPHFQAAVDPLKSDRSFDNTVMPGKNSQVNSKWRIAAAVLGLVALLQGIQIYRVKSRLRNAFHYDVTVTVKDKETGRILEGATTHGPSTSTKDLFHQSTTYSGSVEKPRISGIAYEPREFGFSAGGYKRKNILITDATERAITVELEPIKSDAEQSGRGDSEKPSN